MQVTAQQIQKSSHATYVLWDGEVVVFVQKHCGAHGFWSAAITVDHPDSPIEVMSKSCYKTSIHRNNPEYSGKTFEELMGLRQDELDAWIAEQLTVLSTGTGFNEGGSSEIEGLAS
jgi:hypothetical protein